MEPRDLKLNRKGNLLHKSRLGFARSLLILTSAFIIGACAPEAKTNEISSGDGYCHLQIHLELVSANDLDPNAYRLNVDLVPVGGYIDSDCEDFENLSKTSLTYSQLNGGGAIYEKYNFFPKRSDELDPIEFTIPELKNTTTVKIDPITLPNEGNTIYITDGIQATFSPEQLAATEVLEADPSDLGR